MTRRSLPAEPCQFRHSAIGHHPSLPVVRAWTHCGEAVLGLVRRCFQQHGRFLATPHIRDPGCRPRAAGPDAGGARCGVHDSPGRSRIRSRSRTRARFRYPHVCDAPPRQSRGSNRSTIVVVTSTAVETDWLASAAGEAREIAVPIAAPDRGLRLRVQRRRPRRHERQRRRAASAAAISDSDQQQRPAAGAADSSSGRVSADVVGSERIPSRSPTHPPLGSWRIEGHPGPGLRPQPIAPAAAAHAGV